MQTPKARSGTSEVPQRVSPRPARQLRPSPLDTPDSASSSSAAQSTRTPKERSPKVNERKSPRSPVPEKRRPSRLSELESQIARLQEDLKQAREQLCHSESAKKQAQAEAEESKSQASKLRELSSSEEGRLAELQKISEERDEARLCELEAVEKQRSVDSAALASALDEAQWLKVQLEMVSASEAEQTKRADSASAELHSLRGGFSEALSLVENMKARVKDCEESEARARGLVGETLMQLEAAKTTVESLRLDGARAVSELDETRARVSLLEGLVRELGAGRSESGDLRLEEERIKSTVELRSARELAERVRAELGAEIEELRANLMDKETELQCVAEENRELKSSLAELRRSAEESEAARAGEREALARLRAEAEKAEAARAETAATEAEMRRLRVQSEQWRKAAEAAASMLASTGGDGNNAKYMERTGSLDGSYYNPGPGRFGSIFGDDEDDLLKKKNGNVLKKIGVLWKKPQK